MRSLAPILCACAALAAASAHAPRSDDGHGRCAPPAGSAELLARPGLKILVIGELHGASETPAAFAEIVCHAAQSGREVIVGLEFPESQRPAFDAYLASDGGGDAIGEFLMDTDWAGVAERGAAGHTSAAMFRLIDDLRRMRAQGMRVSIAPFLRPATEVNPESYERGMAASVQGAAEAAPAGLVLILVGDVHARLREVRFGYEAPYRPMAMHFPAEGTVSIRAVPDGGTAWNCAPDCGVHPVRARGDDAALGIDMTPPESGAYDGVLRLGPATASLPVTSADQLEVQ